jgi:hypothetical protein
VSRSFELFQLVSVWMLKQHVRMPLSVRSAMGKHRYGKTVATVRTMWIPVRKHSFIRQVMHSKSKRPDVTLHGTDAQASYIEIACIRSTIRTANVIYRNYVQLKCDRPDAAQFRKEFQRNLESRCVLLLH